MATLYVTEPGTKVHKKGKRLLLRKGKDVLQDIPLIKVDRLILMGRGVSMTTPAMYALTRKEADILYMTGHGGYVSRVVGREHKHSHLRHKQALAVNKPAQALTVSRSIVRGKINNQRVLVMRHAERSPLSKRALANMDKMKRRIDKTHTLDELRGFEGMAAKEYFKLFRQLIHPPKDGRTWGFDRREYYPPPDPINALLSFGYTLLLNDLIAACQVAGLDPDLGFFHAIDYGKPAMALDLEEEFRPILVDSIVLMAVNRSLFRLGDFEERQDRVNKNGGSQHPIYLTKKARKRFVSLYETRISEQIYYPPNGESTSYRRILKLQAYQMAQVILGKSKAYPPVQVK